MSGTGGEAESSLALISSVHVFFVDVVMVAYALKITDIDPVEHALLFERFLNPERTSLPDIDTDFSVEGREKVIRYVSEKYGEDHVAQIVTFNRLSSRAVLRVRAGAKTH